MELRHLRTFAVVAETLSISAAARKLRVTQPALSRQIHALEHMVGHPLFVRHQTGLRLTATGMTLRDHCTKALAAVDDALSSARGMGSKEGTVVRFGYYGISVWENLLAPALEVFARKFPHVTLNMVEESSVHLAADLREGHLDVALLSTGDYAKIPGVTTEVACTVPSMAVVAQNHRLAKKRFVTLEDLRDEEIIGFKHQDAPGKYRAFLAACEEAGFTPQVTYVASIFPELSLAVRKRMGVAILSAFAESVSHPGVVFLKMKPSVPLEFYTAHTVRASAPARELARVLASEARRAAAAATNGK
ncbi:LysR substrate-binding domain-containing protein [Oleiharenicola lentus]|uniref:LysR substrate-binding domain-containing protein n=1 Tax=Oleiharenicola lentus TaxID=2508720 RepID=UPI003F66FC7B